MNNACLVHWSLICNCFSHGDNGTGLAVVVLVVELAIVVVSSLVIMEDMEEFSYVTPADDGDMVVTMDMIVVSKFFSSIDAAVVVSSPSSETSSLDSVVSCDLLSVAKLRSKSVERRNDLLKVFMIECQKKEGKDEERIKKRECEQADRIWTTENSFSIHPSLKS